MAERVYRKKSVEGVTPLASGYTSSVTAVAVPPSPQGEGFGASMTPPSTVSMKGTAQSGQRIYRKKTTATAPQTAQRTFRIRPEVKEYQQAQQLQTWGEGVTTLSNDVVTYFDVINNGEKPAADAYEKMLGRIDTAISGIDTQRQVYGDDAEVTAYIDDVAEYLQTVRGEVEKYKDGIEGVLYREMADRVAAADDRNATKIADKVSLPDVSVAQIEFDNLMRKKLQDATWVGKHNAPAYRDATLKALGHDVYTGLADFNQTLYHAADWIVPDEAIADLFGVENKVGQFFDSMDREYAAIHAKNERLEQYANKTAAFIGDNVITPTVAALPNLAVAMMSGGATVPAQLSASGGSALATSVGTLMKNPSFWLSFAQSGGGAYADAKASGATELEAQAVAWLTAFPSATVEIGGGIEQIPNTKEDVLAFVKNVLEEGGEEVLQGIIEQTARAAVFEQDKQWASFTDADAVFSGSRALQEFIGGVTVGAVLNGGTKATQYAYQSYQYTKLGEQFISGDGGYTIDDAIRIGLSNAKGTDAYNAAVKLQQKVQAGKTVSPYAVGRMVAESQTEQARTARNIERTVLDTAKEMNIPTDAAETVSAAAVSLGQKVEFVSPEGMHNRYMAGEYDRATDTVRLNAAERNVDKLIGAVLAHEMVHTAEGTDQLQKLAQIAERMENHKNGAGAWEKLQADVKSKYATADKQLSDPEVKKEALAHWIAENLFQNKAFAKAVADGDANVGNAFFYMIDRVRRAMGAKKASAGNLAMLERLFMQALDNRTHGGRSGVQGAVNGAPVIDLSDHSELAKRVESAPKGHQTEVIQKYILEALGNEPFRLSDGKMAKVDRSDAHHIARFTRGKESVAQVAEIKKLVENAWLYTDAPADKHNNGHDKFDHFWYYEAVVRYRDDEYSVFLDVGRAKNDRTYHLYHVSAKNKKHRRLNEQPQRPKPNEGYALGSGVSDTTVAQNAPDVNTQSMQEGAGISTQGALLSPESMEAVRNGTWREARAEGADPNANVERDTDAADAATPHPSPTATPSPQGEGLQAVQIDEAAVLDTALRSQLQGRQRVSVDTSARGVEDVAPYIETLEAQLGEPELLKRMYNATRMDRPIGTVEIDGKRVDANAYMDAYEQSLPRDKAALERHIEHLQEQRAAEMAALEQEGALEDYHFGGLKIDLQLFAATRMWDLLQLEVGEAGTEVRQFYEKRLKGTDAIHNQELIDLLAGQSETYNPIGNQKTLDKAKRRLESDKNKARLLERIGKYDPWDHFDAVEVAAGIELIRRAVNDGEIGVAADLIRGLSRKGTEAGRAVQAFSMMARLTPEGALKAAIRTVQADADYAICEGANEGLDVLADDIARAIKEAEDNGLSSKEIIDRIRKGVVGKDAPVQFDHVPQDLADQVSEATGTDVTGYTIVVSTEAMQAIVDGGANVETLVDTDAETLQIIVRDGTDIGTIETATAQQRTEGKKHLPAKLTREELVQLLSEDLAAEKGNFFTQEEIYDLLWKTVNDATNIPEQLKRYVLKKIRKDDGALAQRIYELHQRGDLKQVKLRRAMEEALELPHLTDEDLSWIAEQGAKIESLQDKPVEQADAMEEMYDYLGAKLTVKGLDRLQAWRKFGMLFNVKTHARNVLSNWAYKHVRKVDDAVAMALERIFVRNRSQWGAALGWSHTEHGQSILPKLQEQAELAVLEMQKRGAKYEQGVGMLKQKRKHFGKSKVGEALNKANRWNSDRLEAEDVRFFRPAYIDALGQIMTARKATEITEDMHQIAMKRALEATFRADNAISEVISSLKQFQNANTTGKRLFGHGVDVVIPFQKTPANIATQTILHSPVGIVKGAFDLCNATRGKGSKDAATAINTMAKGVTGTALLAIGLLLGKAGLFNTGFGKSEKERAADEAAGLQDGSFVIGGVSVSLDWLQPAASPLIVGASIAERMDEDGFTVGDVFGAVMDGTDSLFELTMLQSLYDILGGYDAGASGTMMSVGENVVSQSVPTLVGQLARAIDPVQRKTTGDSDFETIVNQVMAKIPGLTYLLDPELDMWGNEVYRTGKPGTGTTVLNALQQFVIPANTKVGTGKDDPLTQEILRLYNDLDTSAVIPSEITYDEASEIGEERVDLNRLLGGVNRLAVEEFVNNRKAYDVTVDTGELTEKGNPKQKKVTKYYRDMTDDERRRVLSNIYKNAKAEVSGDSSHKTEAQLTDSERYFRDLIRRVNGGERGTYGGGGSPAETAPAQKTSTSYFDDLLRRMRNNGN